MARYKSDETEKEAVRVTATIMAASVRTAPKARGIDAIETMILDGEDLEQLALAMKRLSEDKSSAMSPAFSRDAENVRNSECVLLVGVTGEPKKVEQPINCGACGFATCETLLKARKRTGVFSGPNCIIQAIDLGIALSSAVKLANELNIDNRIMYTIGAAAKDLRLLDSDVIMGIPLSVSGKNPYFDRG